jgi:hypothetical protein
MLFPGIKLQGYVRVSLGIENSESDIDRLVDVLRKITHHTTYKTAIISKKEAKRQLESFVSSVSFKVYGLVE